MKCALILNTADFGAADAEEAFFLNVNALIQDDERFRDVTLHDVLYSYSKEVPVITTYIFEAPTELLMNFIGTLMLDSQVWHRIESVE